MLKKGTRAVVEITDGFKNTYHVDVVGGGSNGFNQVRHGNWALSNEFRDSVVCLAALESARNADEVFETCKRYRLYNQTIRLLTDY